jgi:hypothetical protein
MIGWCYFDVDEFVGVEEGGGVWADGELVEGDLALELELVVGDG